MRARTLLMTAAMAALAGGAAAAPPAVVTQPDWLRKPTGEDMAEHYPQAAQVLGLEGRATLSCRVAATGRLTGCEVIDESPKDIGFAQATLAMADTFEMKPQSVNGQPVAGGYVRIPIVFRLPEAEPVTPPAAPAAPEMRRAAEQLVDALGVVEESMRHYDDVAKEIETTQEGAASGAARAAVAGAYREALAAHRADIREAYVRAFAAVFSEEELAAQARFQAAYGKLLRDPQVQAGMAAVTVDAMRAMRAAGHAAFCGRRDCGGPSAVQRVWRAAEARDDRIDIPQWDAIPDPADVAGPQLMTALGVEGVVRMTCRVADDGALKACAVDEEAPAGLGFGEAALKLTDAYRLSSLQLKAGGAGRKVTVRVGFPAADLGKPWEVPKPRSDKALAVARQMVVDSGLAKTTSLQTELQVANFESRTPTRADKAAYAEAIAAYRTGAAQGVATVGEDTARLWSSIYTEDQLTAIEAFYQTPAGKAQKDRQAELEIAAGQAFADLERKISADARRTYCQTHDCTPATPAQPAKAVKPEASTRKP